MPAIAIRLILATVQANRIAKNKPIFTIFIFRMSEMLGSFPKLLFIRSSIGLRSGERLKQWSPPLFLEIYYSGGFIPNQNL